MNPKVSIIMGVYNCQNTLKESIESILNQTFSDFEFIICDDGSTDNTYEIIKEFEKLDNRIKLIRNEKNVGLAGTLNNCLNYADGEYIARMDADDIAEDNRFSEQCYFLDTNKDYSLVGSWAKLFDDNFKWGLRKTKEYVEKSDFLFGTPFIHPTIMIRKKVLFELGGYRVSEETLRAEDYDLFMTLYSKGYKGYNIQKPLINFREDRNTYKRRVYGQRINEAKVRYRGYKKLDLFPKGFIYVLKPIIVGLIPQVILARFRKENEII